MASGRAERRTPSVPTEPVPTSRAADAAKIRASVLVTPLLVDLLRREGIPVGPFVTRQVERLRRAGMGGWQPFATAAAGSANDQGSPALLALRLRAGRLDVEVVIDDGTLTSEGDQVFATLRSAWPATLTSAVANRTFEEITHQASLLAGQGRAVTYARAWDRTGLTIVSFAAASLSVDLEGRTRRKSDRPSTSAVQANLHHHKGSEEPRS